MREPGSKPSPLGSVKVRVEAYRVAEEHLQDARDRLYAAIRDANSKGESLRTLAKVTGLSFPRIQQIVREE